MVGIIQARMGSTRLSGKVLVSIAGQPMLAHLIKRLAPSVRVHKWVVATTCLPQDDPIESLAKHLCVGCFRGSEEDLLDRYYQTALQFQATDIVRLTADNPLMDAEFVDWVVSQYMFTHPTCDYASSGLSHTFPLGLSVEVFSFNALARAWREDTQREWREHVTPYIYRHPEVFQILSLASSQDYSNLRWTVDTAEDLAMVRKVYKHFGNDTFSWREVLALLDEHPDWHAINAHVQQRAI